MTALWELAALIRSKNAGPFWLTIDVMFDDTETYELVRRSGVLTPESIAATYRTDVANVKFIAHDAARALKVSLPRPAVSGSAGDGDVYGGQFHAPLVDLEVPTPTD